MSTSRRAALALSCVAAAAALAPTLVARAQEERPEPTLDEDLARRPDEAEHGIAQTVVDPTAPLVQLAVILEHDPTYHGPEDTDATALTLRAAVPFETWGVAQLFRASLVYDVDSPEGGSGLADTELFDLVLLPLGPGRAGVGPVISLRPDDGAESETGTITCSSVRRSATSGAPAR